MTKKTEEKNSGKSLVPQAAAGLPAELMGEMEQDAGRGISDNPNDESVPFIAVLQDMSPQVKERDAKYVPGAKVGMLFNNVTQEVYPLGIEFLPVHYESCHVEWVPRDSGGGFVAKHPFDTPLLREAAPNPLGKGAPRLPSGNDLVETRYWYGLFRAIPAQEGGEFGAWQAGVIGFSSTGLRVSREWVGATKRILLPGSEKVAPIFSTVYRVTTQLFSKNNNEWFLPAVARERWVTAAEYASARRYAELAEAGGVRVAQPEPEGGGREDVI